jgi:hypothetical protein
MQKVEGSSPFSRLKKGPQMRAFVVPDRGRSGMSPETVSQTPPFKLPRHTEAGPARHRLRPKRCLAGWPLRTARPRPPPAAPHRDTARDSAAATAAARPADPRAGRSRPPHRRPARRRVIWGSPRISRHPSFTASRAHSAQCRVVDTPTRAGSSCGIPADAEPSLVALYSTGWPYTRRCRDTRLWSTSARNRR